MSSKKKKKRMDVGACHTNRHGETSLSRALSVTRATSWGKGKEREDVSIFSFCLEALFKIENPEQILCPLQISKLACIYSMI